MSDSGTIHLGARQVVVDGKVIGSIDDVTLEVGESDADTLRVLIDAHVVSLFRIGTG
jgi:hypothetical protein